MTLTNTDIGDGFNSILLIVALLFVASLFFAPLCVGFRVPEAEEGEAEKETERE